jgi:hypothetical protein
MRDRRSSSSSPVEFHGGMKADGGNDGCPRNDLAPRLGAAPCGSAVNGGEESESIRAVVRFRGADRRPRSRSGLRACEHVCKKRARPLALSRAPLVGRKRTLDSHASRLRRKLNRRPKTAYAQRLGRRLPARRDGTLTRQIGERSRAAGRSKRGLAASSKGRRGRAETSSACRRYDRRLIQAPH